MDPTAPERFATRVGCITPSWSGSASSKHEQSGRSPQTRGANRNPKYPFSPFFLFISEGIPNLNSTYRRKLWLRGPRTTDTKSHSDRFAHLHAHTSDTPLPPTGTSPNEQHPHCVTLHTLATNWLHFTFSIPGIDFHSFGCIYPALSTYSFGWAPTDKAFI